MKILLSVAAVLLLIGVAVLVYVWWQSGTHGKADAYEEAGLIIVGLAFVALAVTVALGGWLVSILL